MTARDILLSVLQMYDDVGVPTEQLYCLAENIYHEARSEPLAGQIAVAHTTINRVKDKRYPDTICEVVTQTAKMKEDNPSLPELHKCQFSWYCDGLPDTIRVSRNGVMIEVNANAFKTATIVAIEALKGEREDNTLGSTHYYNYNLVDPTWAKVYTVTVTHGNHRFIRREKNQW